MLLKLSLAALLALSLHGQTVTIDVGAPTEKACTGAVWNKANDLAMGALAAPFDTLRYGTAVTCDVQVTVGTCVVTLRLMENRPAVATPTVPAAGLGLRVFTIAANGVSTGPLDLFALAGPQTPYALSLPKVPVTDGHLRISAVASKGNASIAGIEASCAPTPVPPFTQNADGSWTFTGDFKATGYVESGFGSTAPSRLTLRLPDGSSVDGTSGTVRIGACTIKLQAGAVVGVMGCPIQ